VRGIVDFSVRRAFGNFSENIKNDGSGSNFGNEKIKEPNDHVGVVGFGKKIDNNQRKAVRDIASADDDRNPFQFVEHAIFVLHVYV